ncbi:WD40 repeat-like protein [Amylocystis lapponica]|nr:WD40 repeat-like protein [Amylocystis lapponica]
MAIDFSMTPSAGAEAWPVAWSQNNMLVFSRGNRVHFKNLAVDSGTGQLCKVRESHGGVQLIACAGEDQPNIVAVCTGKGRIELWDLLAKKMTASWSTHSFGAVAWNGPILSVGSNRGTIRHFDTRIKDTPKMKEQTKRVTRHQAKICSLTWHEEGKMFASGDASGVVLAWDSRQNVPLDVGETVQRRKKMQHVGPVTALTWCPWQSRMLASGDSAPDGTGTIRIWDVSTTPSAFPKSNHPKKLELDATIRSLHFSTQCKELLCAHGPGKFTPAPPPSFGLDSLIPYDSSPRPAKIANSVVVYAYPTLRSLATVSVSCQDVAGSVQSPNGLRIALAIPGEKQVSVWDVWAKRKDLRRHSSFDTVIR